MSFQLKISVEISSKKGYAVWEMLKHEPKAAKIAFELFCHWLENNRTFLPFYFNTSPDVFSAVWLRILTSILNAASTFLNLQKNQTIWLQSLRAEVIGFKNPSARHADVPLRSPQHKSPVQKSKTADLFSSDVERIGSLDGRVLPASKNAQKFIKWTTDDKIRNVAAMRKLRFAMRRSARRHKVLASSHGSSMPSSASFLKESKDKKAFAFQTAPPSSITGIPYKTKITTPFKLTILPTEETVIPSVDTADVESELPSKQGNTTEKDDQKSSRSGDKKESSSPHGAPKVNGHEGSTQYPGTSAMPLHKMVVPPGVKPSSGLRWNPTYDLVKLDDSKKRNHFKDKKKKYHAEDDEEPTDSSSPATTFEGILVGIVMLLLIFTGVPRLW